MGLQAYVEPGKDTAPLFTAFTGAARRAAPSQHSHPRGQIRLHVIRLHPGNIPDKTLHTPTSHTRLTLTHRQTLRPTAR